MSSSVLGRVFPRFPSTVTVEIYRQVGKIRVFVAGLCLLMNAGTALSMEQFGIDEDYWLLWQIPNNLAIASSLVLGLVIWKGRLSAARSRSLTFAAIVAEMISMIINLSLYGSVNSHMLLAAIFLVLMYRATFDFQLGVTGFLMLFLGQWIVVACEVTGLVPAQGAIAGVPDQIYASAQRELVSASFGSLFLVLSFWGVNWAVLRLRHKERAIRILRETLVATDVGRVGRHTGRTLKDTYLVGSLLGVGGMGEVYDGSHRRTRRPVAIKLLHPHLIDDPVLLTRFRREAEIAGSVGSEHIVEVIDVDTEDDQPFIVLELLEGDSLQDRIARDGAMPLDEAVDVFEQLAAGLEAAHGAGIVHRDLKPENIVLSDTDRGTIVKILDFGISKISGNATAITREVALLGTPDFMSPEQAVGHAEDVDREADIFGFGAVLYFALTGQRPFHASSVPALLRRICDEEPIPIEKLRKDLGAAAMPIAAVVALAMAKRPEQRYASATEIAADLRRAVAGELPAEVVERAASIERGQPSSSTAGDTSVSATDATVQVAD